MGIFINIVNAQLLISKLIFNSFDEMQDEYKEGREDRRQWKEEIMASTTHQKKLIIGRYREGIDEFCQRAKFWNSRCSISVCFDHDDKAIISITWAKLVIKCELLRRWSFEIAWAISFNSKWKSSVCMCDFMIDYCTWGGIQISKGEKKKGESVTHLLK